MLITNERGRRGATNGRCLNDLPSNSLRPYNHCVRYVTRPLLPEVFIKFINQLLCNELIIIKPGSLGRLCYVLLV